MENPVVRRAENRDIDAVCRLVTQTIMEIYPHYYPAGAVSFFRDHHREAAIREDIQAGIVFILKKGESILGTVTVKENEIDRLFVLPSFQKRGYGSMLLDFAENHIAQNHVVASLCASLPAKSLYLHRGYASVSYHCLSTENGDMLCYDVMKKAL